MLVNALVAFITLVVGSVSAVTIQEAAIVLHNNYRRIEAKEKLASNIYELVWDADLALQAQQWSDACQYHHHSAGDKGENLYYSRPRTGEDSYYVQKAVDKWMSEKPLNADGSYDCCFRSNLTCCHYTQVISSKSTKIGCGVGHCEMLVNNGVTTALNAAFVTCFYYPMGNLAINGQHVPFSHGTPCSACAVGDTCNDGLCVDSGQFSQ